jgi:hypothetical protein
MKNRNNNNEKVIHFEQIIRGNPRTFVGMMKRYIAQASDNGIEFSIPDEMLMVNKNPIKICWENKVDGRIVSGVGWIDGHEIPGNKTKLTILFGAENLHLQAGWDWIVSKLIQDDFIELNKKITNLKQNIPGGKQNKREYSDIFVPSRPADLQRWELIWKDIKHKHSKGDSNTKIAEFLNEYRTNRSCSVSTLSKIIKAGQAGKLD